jgi:hypothetical protein
MLKELEGKKNKLLEWEESKWRMKSRATWLPKGDENTKFFYNNVERRKNINTIWEIGKGNGSTVNRL